MCFSCSRTHQFLPCPHPHFTIKMTGTPLSRYPQKCMPLNQLSCSLTHPHPSLFHYPYLTVTTSSSIFCSSKVCAPNMGFSFWYIALFNMLSAGFVCWFQTQLTYGHILQHITYFIYQIKCMTQYITTSRPFLVWSGLLLTHAVHCQTAPNTKLK